MANRTEEYLAEIRALDGLKNAILCSISVAKRDNSAEFFLVTDRTYSAEEEAQAREITERYLPTGFSARLKIVKRVPDAQIIGDKIFASCCRGVFRTGQYQGGDVDERREFLRRDRLG